MARIWEGMLISSPSEDAEEARCGEVATCSGSRAVDSLVKWTSAYRCLVIGRPRDTHARCAEVPR